MKTQSLALVLAIILIVSVLAGCSSAPASSVVSVPSSTSAPAPAPPQLTQLQQDIISLELACAETPSAENYNALAALYSQAGYIKKQRDTLELCYKQFADTAALDALQSVVVNIAEDDLAVQVAAKQLIDNLLVADYNKEAAAQLIDANWLAIMMPTLSEGKRGYYLDDEALQSTLYFEVGYDSMHNNLAFSRVWLANNSTGQLTYLLKQGNAIQFVYTAVAEGIYNGDFSAWRYIGNPGTVYHDVGTFQNGILVGEFTSTTYKASDAVDLYALVSSQEGLTETVYTGDFGTNGVTTLTQPKNATDFVAYAYTSDEKNYLSYGMVGEENPSSYAFGSGFFGLPLYPAYQSYTPAAPIEVPQGEVTVDPSQVQLRINGTNVEWFDGENWHVVGPTSELYAQDPNYVPPTPEVNDPAAEEDDTLWFMRSNTGTGTPPSSGGGGGGTRPRSSSSTAPPAVVDPPPEAPPPVVSSTQPPPPPSSSEPPMQPGDGDDIGWTEDWL